jgi:fumarate reductase flavoprotein subunit
MMGGVDVDIDGATPIPGLYAAGETACVSLNGANRLGSNSLTECLVFGARAGEHAVGYARGAAPGEESELRGVAEDESARLDALRARQRGGETLSGIRGEMNDALESGCGVYREEGPMRAACEKLAELRRRFEDVSLKDASPVFNTELVAALELANMLDVAESVAVSALSRKESRGAHTRRDFPHRDDEGFLYHTLAYYDDAGPRLDRKDVTLGRWEPEERKY